MIKKTKDRIATKEATDIMLSDITGIRLTGGNFTSPTDLSLFPPPEENQKNKEKLKKDIIIYGKNGAGKSTIARAIRTIAEGSNLSQTYESELLDKNRSIIDLSDEEKKRICVFDEEFIDKNVKFQEQGLDTIIMLGESVNLTQQIAKQEEDLAPLEEAFNAQEALLAKYDKSESVESPSYWLRQIKHNLQGDSNWAGREKAIRQLKQNAPVNDETYKQFLNIQPSDSRDNLDSEYKKKMKKLETLRQYTDNHPISTPVPLCHLKDYKEESIRKLLAQKIERPVISDRERMLVELGVQKLEKIHETFSNPSITECPYCFQPISQNYKNQLIQSIEKALNQTVNRHRDDLRNCQQEQIHLDLVPYRSLPSYYTCQDLLSALNQAIQSNNQKLSKKYNDPYTPIEEDISPATELCNKLNKSLSVLNAERHIFNSKNTEIETLKEELTHLNKEITYYDIHNSVLQYDKQSERQQTVKKEFEDITKKKEKAEKKLSDLEAQLKNVTVALDLINGYLQYIFFDENRLKITFQNDTYTLLSNGHSVCPSQISTGERNIIALCYYFAHIMQGQAPAKACQKDYLLVIDDPVSSFDMNNRVGIMSFLSFQIEQFLTGNPQTHFMILTHNLQVYYDLKDIFQTIYKSPQITPKRQFHGMILSKNQLSSFSGQDSDHMYSALMSIIYDYAGGKADTVANYDLSIGNMMRQVLEAFSTFLYRKGITEITADQDIAKILEQKQVSPYFKRLMYGTMLHGESHTEIKVSTMQNMNFLPAYSTEEKQKIAKSILCLIYILVPKHLLSHLIRKPNLVATMKKWCDEIRKETPPNP